MLDLDAPQFLAIPETTATLEQIKVLGVLWADLNKHKVIRELLFVCDPERGELAWSQNALLVRLFTENVVIGVKGPRSSTKAG